MLTEVVGGGYIVELWLTRGGRIVIQPKSGESCSVSGGDTPLYTDDELKAGIKVSVFIKDIIACAIESEKIRIIQRVKLEDIEIHEIRS